MPTAEPEVDFNALPRGTVFRVSALALVAVSLAMVLVWLLSGGGTEFFRPKSELRTYLSDGAGVIPGADVLLNGLVIGRVKAISLTSTLDPNRIVEIRLEIQKRYMEKIPVDSIAAVTAANLLGDEFVNITLGKASEHVGDGAEIASLIQSGSFNPADLVASLRDTMSRIDFVLTDIEQGQSPLALIVHGNGLYTSLLQQVSTFQSAIASFADRKSPNGQFIYSDAEYQKLRKTLTDLDHSLGQIQSGQGSAGRFLESPAAYDQAVAQVHSVRQSIIAANPTASDAKYKQLMDRIHAIDQTVDRLTVGTGGVPKLLQSREMYDSLNGQAAKARDFERELRENPRKFLRIQVRGGKKKKPQP